jgi:PAS domain S-box-containing protein
MRLPSRFVPDEVGAPTAPPVRAPKCWWQAAALGVGLPLVTALLLELAPDPLDLQPAAVLLLAVLIAALIGQQRTGAVAGVTAIVVVWLQFTEPRFSGEITTWSSASGVVVFAVSVVLVVLMTVRVEEARRRERDERALSDVVIGEAPIGMALLDLDLRFTRVNQAMADMNGLPLEHHRGKRPADVDPRAERMHEHLLEWVRETGESITDASLSNPVGESGVERHWSATYYPVHDDEGRTIAVGAVVREVTDAVVGRQRSQLLADLARQLAAAATLDEIAEAVTEFLASAFRARVMLAFVEGDTVVVHPSSRGYESIGPVVPLLPGRPLTDVILHGRPFAVASLEEYEDQYPHCVWIMTTPRDESSVWVPITDPFDDGRVLAVFRLGWSGPRRLSEISHRLHETLASIIALAISRTQLAEARDRDRFRAALDAMLDQVTIARSVRGADGTIEDFQIEFVNRASEDGAGRRADTMQGRMVNELYPNWRSSGMFDRFVDVVDSGVAISEERLLYNDTAPDGTVIDGYWSLRAARLGDGYIAASRDVTAVVLAESEAQRAAVIAEQHRVAVDLLQRAALPVRLPGGSRYAVGADHRPAAGGQAVGGDWYDAFELDDNRIALVIADVAGHGPEAAALMLQARNITRAVALDGGSPGDVLGKVNRVLMRAAPPSSPFITCLYAVVDLAACRLAWARAGHLEPLIIHGGSVALGASASDVPLGVSIDAGYRTLTMAFGPGDSVVIFTDGLVERRSESIDVGLERLRRLVEGSPRRSPQDMVEHLIATVDEPEDDIAVICLERTA